ncbi:MAG: hypothetical protein AAB407_00605 [Patescibacteria group bacterium]
MRYLKVLSHVLSDNGNLDLRDCGFGSRGAHTCDHVQSSQVRTKETEVERSFLQTMEVAKDKIVEAIDAALKNSQKVRMTLELDAHGAANLLGMQQGPNLVITSPPGNNDVNMRAVNEDEWHIHPTHGSVERKALQSIEVVP